MKRAKTSTKTWATKNISTLKLSTDELFADERNFIPWLNWSTERVWLEHSQRLGGLFDPEFIPQIAKVLDVSTKELESLWRMSQNAVELRSALQTSTGSSDLKLVEKAYVASALIRGRYHDDVARASQWQVMHHPLREGVFPIIAIDSSPSHRDFPISNVERYLATILLASAFDQKQARRVDTWVRNVLQIREMVERGNIDTRTKDDDGLALDLAIRGMRDANIDFGLKKLDVILEAGSSLGTGVFSSFFLSPWASLAVTGASYSASIVKDRLIRQGSSASVATRLAKRRNRLLKLATAGPGRVQRRWR